jgi:murein DD-endopeptidase MepM/ murein hydrolase activator NlpD
MALIYSTKPDGSTAASPAPGADTALVANTAAGNDSLNGPLVDTMLDARAPRDSAFSPSISIAGGESDLQILRSEGIIVPVSGVAAEDLVDTFDQARDGTRHHSALDIMAPRNTPVIAAVDGKVLKLHNSVAGGLTIYLSDKSGHFEMLYGHLDSYRPGIAEGQALTKGQIIGFTGSTGNASPDAPHLHFQVMRNDNQKEWWKGTPVNPFPVFRPKGL